MRANKRDIISTREALTMSWVDYTTAVVENERNLVQLEWYRGKDLSPLNSILFGGFLCL